MPPLTAEIITAAGGVLLGLLAGIPTAVAIFRRLKPEVKTLDAQAEESEARADEAEARAIKVQAESWVLLINTYQDRLTAMNTRLSDMEKLVGTLIEEKNTSARTNEALRRENQELKIRLCDVEENKIPAMEAEIQSLREQIIALGGRPKTGPLGKAGRP